MPITPLPRACVALLLMLPSAAHAAEVDFEGYYRARGRAYDTLTLDRSLANNEGFAAYVQHRLWLRPRFFVTDDVAMYVDIRGLDGVTWGDEPVAETDAVTGEDVPTEFTDQLRAPTSETDETAPLLDLTLWRVWGEVDTDIGRFRFGRMPLRWGVGLWWNDGLSWNGDYGDSADRVAWDETFDDVFVELALDVNAERFVGENDDTVSYNAAVGYRAESVTAGLQAQLRRTPSREFNLFSLDGAVQARVGTLDIRAEGIGQFGAGDLENGVNDVAVTQAGAVLDLGLHLDPFEIGLEGGFASGDADPNDQRLKTFSFDPDYNVGIILFEQPIPVLAAASANENNAGRNYQAALLGDAVSNALYIRPRLSRTIIDGLRAEAALLAARTARVSELQQNRKGYGIEIDAGLGWRPVERFDVTGTFGVLLPGTFFREYSDETYSGFDDTVYAGQIIGQVSF